MRSREGVAALAMLVAVTAFGREPDVRGYKSYAMPAYTIVTHDENVARQVPTQTAMIEAVLAKVLQREPSAPGVPTYVFVASQNLWSGYLQPATGIDDEYVAGRFANYLLINDCRCDSGALRRAVYHQYAHYFLHTQLGGILPLWFDEGMARIAENTEFLESRAYLGTPYVLYQSWIPLTRLLNYDRSSPAFSAHATRRAVQDESWGMVYRAISEPAFGKQLFAFLDALGDLEPVDQAVQSSFGMSTRQLNRDLHLYVRGNDIKVLWVDVDLPKAKAFVPGRDMSEIETLELLADTMLASGFKPQRLAAVVAAAHRRAPDSPSVQVLRMRLALRDRDYATFEQLLAALEPRLADPQVARDVGLVLFDRVRGNSPEDNPGAGQKLQTQQRALALLDRALRARAEDPEAAWVFGMLAASTKQMQGTALQRLLSASESLPTNADIAAALALVYESQGQTGPMIAHLKDTLRFSRSIAQRAWAKSYLVNLRALPK